MTEVERILDQYERAMDGDAWHGDPVWTILGGISADQAAWRISPPIHTIWELVAHMTFWETEVRRRVSSLPARSVDELNFPLMPAATAENWSETLANFRRSNSEFRSMLEKLGDSQLNQPMAGREKSVYVEIHGVIQHHLYHAGQIAILRRILAASTVIPRL